ncbi:glutathione S-transferase family protein [Cyanobium sp. NIES-981]|uniref:glutathione S-transferase family protein n=1 Tax=Cyanobium sp. NIES-981 TaxID=1851505 RepID=UPI0007DDCFEF|nr:glutathione S-transferase [Cyanobium sp. NIES-981]SBO43369.1 Protein GstA [Cyanobium sp. NIES-981]
MLQLHGHPLSGNSYKVRLLLELLQVPYTWVEVDLLAGEHRQPPFLALNPFGQVPVLVDDTAQPPLVLADAQAILWWLASRFGHGRWLPADLLGQTQVVRWLSTAAGEVRQGPESARLHHVFKATAIPIERAHQKAAFILGQLERHLAASPWLVGDAPTIADVAVFPYVALAPEGGIDLAPYPAVGAWIARIRALPGFVPMRGMAPVGQEAA